MQDKIILDLQAEGFLESRTVNDEEFFHLTTPCRFRIKEEIVHNLKSNYVSYEEIGGILWAKPTIISNEKIYVIDKVSFIRNSIEDKPRTDHRNKSNAYLPDIKQLNKELNEVFNSGYLPVKFHTHPIKGSNFLDSLTYTYLKTDTSKQDKLESELPHLIGSKKLLMPRGLIVGNDVLGNDIFIGVYNGFVAPTNFEQSKKKIQEENFKKTATAISKIKLSNEQKIGVGIGAVLLLFVIIKYRKYSLPVILGLVATLPILLTNTQNQENPNYFNRLLFGEADIYIPQIEGL